MKHLIICLFILFAFNNLSAKKMFTAIKGEGETLYSAFSEERGGFVIRTALLKINLKNMEFEKFAFTDDLTVRKIIAIIQGTKNLYVLSQNPSEGGDDPTLLKLDPKTNKWAFVGSINCPHYNFITIEKQSFSMECRNPQTDPKIQKPIYTKKLKIKNDTLNLAESKITIPQKYTSNLSINADFKSTGVFWDAIELKNVQTQKTRNIKAEDIEF